MIKPGTVDVFDWQAEAASFVNTGRDIGDCDGLVIVPRENQ
jgi:hypothetical protein